MIKDKRLVRSMMHSDMTIEDLARAMASMDRKLKEFDQGKIDEEYDDKHGHYLGYISDAEELIRRASQYVKNES